MLKFANAAYLEGFPFPALLSVAPYCVPGGVRVVSNGRGLRTADSFALDALCAMKNQQNPGSDSLYLPGNAASPLASRESTNCGQGKLHPPQTVQRLLSPMTPFPRQCVGTCFVYPRYLPCARRSLWHASRGTSCVLYYLRISTSATEVGEGGGNQNHSNEYLLDQIRPLPASSRSRPSVLGRSSARAD